MNTLNFIIFFSIAITVLGGFNYYFINKHRRVIKLKKIPKHIATILLIVLIISPLMATFLSYNDIHALSAFFSLVGYSWMAFIYLFLEIHLAIDIIFFILQRLCIYNKSFPKLAYLATVLSSFAILAYGNFEADNILIKTINIKTTKDINYNIVQLSDIHFSAITSDDKAQVISQNVNALKPDILIITGDTLDRGIKDIHQIENIFKQIHAPLGKYAVMGNHEYYFGKEKSINFYKNAEIKLLINEKHDVDQNLSIVGIDDAMAKRYINNTTNSESKVMEEIDSNKFVIIAKHRPDVLTPYLDKFDLQISGHTHGGQIYLFSFIVKIANKYLKGMYNLSDRSKIYVSNGTGTWGPPFRFLTPPEITQIKISNH